MKKKIFVIMLIFILILINSYLIFNYIYVKYRNKTSLENHYIQLSQELSQSPFKIDKILLYSSISGINKNTNFQNTNWLLDIFQYTDIAIYLTSNQPIKTLSISNPKFTSNSQKLYYLDSTKFGTDTILNNYEITKSLDYTVLNFENNDNSIKFNTPVFFADASNPITLKLTNTLLQNFSIPNSEKIVFDGTLFSKTNLTQNILSVNLSFNIEITNYSNEKYSTLLNVSIPLEECNSIISDGYIYLENINLNIPFFSSTN